MSFAGILQLVGAAFVLAAFVATQNGIGRPNSTYVLILNTLGAGILAYLALTDAQWGFLALEGIWSVLAAANLVKKLTLRRPRTASRTSSRSAATRNHAFEPKSYAARQYSTVAETAKLDRQATMVPGARNLEGANLPEPRST